jgi:hypothetical protein
MQASRSPHWVLQPPQYLGSFRVSRHWPAHSSNGGVHTHCEFWQLWPFGHLCPQPPQLSGSVVVLMHRPPQEDVPGAHRHSPWLLHTCDGSPQLASVRHSTQAYEATLQYGFACVHVVLSMQSTHWWVGAQTWCWEFAQLPLSRHSTQNPCVGSQ